MKEMGLIHIQIFTFLGEIQAEFQNQHIIGTKAKDLRFYLLLKVQVLPFLTFTFMILYFPSQSFMILPYQLLEEAFCKFYFLQLEGILQVEHLWQMLQSKAVFVLRTDRFPFVALGMQSSPQVYYTGFQITYMRGYTHRFCYMIPKQSKQFL